jgi:hypothetical protein
MSTTLKPAALGLPVCHRPARRSVLCALALALAWLHPALAQQAPVLTPANPPPAQPLILVPPPAAIQFQRSMQEQQLRDQLQQRQLENDLRRGVNERARQALDPASRNRAQLDQAAQAQQARDQAAQQALIDQYWGTSHLPPPAAVSPARARSGQ